MRYSKILILLILFSGCSKKVVRLEEGPDVIFQKGVEYLSKGNYKEAEKSFERIIYNHPASAFVEDAQFFLAETHLKKGDCLSAKEEFDFFIKNFPASRYIEEASYKFSLASLRALPGISRDQEEISKVKEFILEFKDRYPNSFYLSKMDSLLLEIETRWARKELDAGLLYYKAGEIEAARVYFEYITKEFPETEVAHEAEFFLGEIFLKNGNREAAREIFERLQQKPLKEAIREKIRRYLLMM